jgi:hypothetical protein
VNVAKTNSERQAAYRERRALTPKDQWAFRRALLEAYFVGQSDAREFVGERRDERREDPIAHIIQESITSLETEQAEEPERFLHEHLLTVLRALDAASHE